ncbi:MAG: class I SAM-dependent methyltransferase [Dehalococcoidia bacterium]
MGVITRWLGGPAGLPFVNGPAMMLPQTLDLRPEHRLLDIGAGSGALARLLHTIVGFESPPVALDASARVLATAPGSEPRIAPVRGTAARLPLAGTSFDVVLLSHVIGTMDDETFELALREVRRILKPGGVCLLWEYGPRSSALLDRFNRWFLQRFDQPRVHLRSSWQIATEASNAAFARIRVLDFAPFYWPPIPRVALLLQRAGNRRDKPPQPP